MRKNSERFFFFRGGFFARINLKFKLYAVDRVNRTYEFFSATCDRPRAKIMGNFLPGLRDELLSTLILLSGHGAISW